MKEKLNYRILDDSEATMLEFYITKSNDGFVFGIKRLKTDVHLTVLPNRGKLRVHITDTSELSDIDKVIWDQGTKFSVIEKKVLRLVKPLFQRYHGNKKGWIFTKEMKEQIENVLLPKEVIKNHFNISINSLGEIILPDFKESKYWKRIYLREAINTGDLVFIEYPSVIKIAYVLDNDHKLCLSQYQLKNLIEYFLDILGLNQYLDYLMIKFPKKKLLYL